MISEKMKELTKNSSAIRAMFEEGKRLSALYGPDAVYDYSIGNPATPPPPSVKKAILHILEEEPSLFIHGYTNNAGHESVRACIAEQVKEEFNQNLTADNVILTNGAAGGLNIILKTILNPGDEVVVFAPYFGEYAAYVKNYDGKLVVLGTELPDFSLPIEKLEQAVTKKTKAVIINSPNNPTGAVYSAESISALSQLLQQKQKENGSPIYLIADEPYRRIVFDDTPVPFPANYYPNTFTAYSFSKALSLPGERIGYVIANTEMDGFREIMNSLNVANRICGFVNAPSLFQLVLPYCIRDTSDISLYTQNRNALCQMLTELGFTFHYPKGAFYVFPKALIPDDIAFCNAAKEFRLLLVPGSSFGCPGYFRAAFCVSEKMIAASRESFQALSKKFGGTKL